MAAIERLPPEKKDDHSTKMEEYMTTYQEYLGHIIRTKYHGDYYRYFMYLVVENFLKKELAFLSLKDCHGLPEQVIFLPNKNFADF